MIQNKRIKILFVCMGNICRSPTADAVFRHFVKEARIDHMIDVDSAGTHAYHIGKSPDYRAQGAALQRGYRMHELCARVVQPDDFEKFDYILAMDRENLTLLQQQSPKQYLNKIKLFMQYAKNANLVIEVPDPYFGGQQGFERVLDMIEEASKGLLEHLCNDKTEGKS